MALLAALALAAGAAGAHAAPAQVQVRIEGKSETLFEGPVLTEGHDIRAASETEEHPCDGINPNDPGNLTPGPTPTASAVDAMSIIGETFDGQWYSSYDDYLITRWGPQQEAGGESWTVSVNSTPLDVGGCQYELREGAEVLWSFGPPSSRPELALFPQGASAPAPPLTAYAQPGVPFGLEVLAYKAKSDGKPPPLPERTGASAYPEADVAPVQTAANGFERPLTEAPQTVETDSEGKATITFTSDGWHRIMATAPKTIRSNRLDICVSPEGPQGCGPEPADDEPRCPPGRTCESPPSGAQHEATQTGGSQGQRPGPGASGSQTSSPAEHTGHELRIDGLTLVPLGARSHALHFHGRWRRRRERGAWDGTTMIGSARASLTLTLAAGRPAFILRDVSGGSRVEVRSHGRTLVRALAASDGGTELLLASLRARRGEVTLRVLSGAVGVDGVAVTA